MDIIEHIKEIELTYCRNCGSFRYRDRWLSPTEFQKAFDAFMLRHITFRIKPSSVQIDKRPLGKPEKIMEFKIDARETEDKRPQSYIVPASCKMIECPRCSRLKSQYYEGTFQLRNPENSAYHEVYQVILDETAKRKDAAITKSTDVKNGVDLQFTSQKFMQQLGSRLVKEFGGEYKITTKLFTRDRQSGKEVYRVNVLLRLPGFNKGDIVKHKGKLLRIDSFSKDMAGCIDLSSWKRINLKFDDLELAASGKDLLKAAVIKRRPQIEVLHPTTFESTVLQNNTSSNKDDIMVLAVGDRLWAVE